MIKKKKLPSSPSMRKQYFVANNLLGEWGSMQMTVMSEGLLLKWLARRGVFELYSHSYLL